MKRIIFALAFAAVMVAPPAPAVGHAPAAGKDAHHAAGGDNAMQAQHERMARFQDAARKLTEAIVVGDRAGGAAAAALLARSLEGHENDVPHRNRARSKEFHGLFAELGKRTETLRGALAAGDLKKSAAAYGRVLEVCVSCHAKFRD